MAPFYQEISIEMGERDTGSVTRLGYIWHMLVRTLFGDYFEKCHFFKICCGYFWATFDKH